LLTLILSSGVCLADSYVGGIPLTSVQSGTVDGGVYFDSYYGMAGQASKVPLTIDRTFTLPADAEVEWAMLLTTVYCGHMQNNYQGTANVSFNGETLGNETLNVPFTFINDGGAGYVEVNDHVNRVTSDYMIYYDVTNLVKAGENTAIVSTAPLDSSFDGRVKLISLVVAYNDGSGNKIWYQVNRGHDVVSYYSDDYMGSTDFQAALPEDSSLTDADLTVVHMASTDGVYTFNGNTIASGTPQGSYCGSNTWDVKDFFESFGTNTLSYNRNVELEAAFYKCALCILTAEYTESQVSAPVADFTVNVTGGEAPLAVQFSDASTGTVSSYAWDFDNDGTVDSTEQDPSFTYTTAGTYTVNLTVTNAGGSDSEVKDGYITVNAAETSDLTISGTVNTVPSSAVFAKEANPVKVSNIKNNGTDTLTNISVALYASDVPNGEIPVNTTTIASLGGGEVITVTLIDPTIRNFEGGTVTYTAVVDPDNLVSETNEANNNKNSSTKTVKYNGYKGKRYWEGGSDITTRQTFDLYGNLIYFTQPLSAYKSVGWTGRTETWNEGDLPVPRGSTVEKVLLYVAYNWDTTPGGVPNWTATFNDDLLTGGTLYTDKSNFGGYANYIYGLCVFDVTARFKTGGNSLIMTPGSDNSNALYPSTLVVIYKDPAETRKQIFINEECDELGYSESSLGTTVEEATAYAPFTGMSIDVDVLQKAVLYSFAGSAGPDEGNLLFNGNTVATNAWMGDSSSISAQIFDVKGYLNETGNEAGIQGTTAGGMAVLQQVLVIEYPAAAPVAAFTATPTSGDAPLTVQFTDESTGMLTSWLWDFDNDGNADSTEQNPTFTYGTAGAYSVNLTVSNEGGSDFEMKEGFIVVNEALPEVPVADFTANVTSGDTPLAVQFTDASTGTVSSYAWDFENDGTVDSTEQNPLHTYVNAGTYSVKLTATNAGGSDEKLKTGYITVTEPPVSEPDLVVSTLTPNAGEIFASEANTISAKVENSGTAAAGPFTVRFDVNDFSTNVTVDSLSAGANTTLSITDPTIRVYGGSVGITATADSENSVIESDETNNALSLTKTVVYNGYKGKRWTDGDDINTRETFEGKYDLIYSSGDSTYASTKWLSVTDSWTSSDLSTPADATIVSVRLYQPYAYNKMGVDPAFTAVFNGVTISTDATCRDTKGYGSYNYPYGLYVYNVTDQFSTAGNTLTLTPEGTPGTTNDYSLWGAYLVVVYSDQATTEKQIFINDEFDMLYSRSSYSVTSDEATAYANFSGVSANDIESAEVIAVLASAGDSGKSKFFFNDKEYTGFWADYLAPSQIGFSVYNVTDKLESGANEARLQSYDSGNGGDNMYAMNAILVVEYPETAPVADFSADPTSGIVPLTVQFTDASSGTVSSYAWDFDNDGTVDSTEQSPSYTYESAGTYTVNLTVSNSDGSDSEVKTEYIVVSEPLPAPPVALFSATPTSGEAPLTVQFTDESTGSPASWLWDFGDGSTASEQNVSHTYTSAGNYTVTLTVSNAGGSDEEVKAECITVTGPPVSEPDLFVSALTINAGEIFANEANTISAKVENSGTAAAGSFTVSFAVNGVDMNATVDSLSAGANTTLSITDPTIRAFGDSVEITAAADSENSIIESNETNNALSLTTTVVYNGYKGKRWTDGDDINTRATFEGKYGLVYSTGNTSYSGAGWTENTYTWTASDLLIPDGASVVSARLYQPYSYNKMASDPVLVMSFNGNPVPPDATYTDRKNFGSYDYPYGLYAYNVTSLFNPEGNSITVTPEVGNNYAIFGAYMVVVYSDQNASYKKIWINEEFDMLYCYTSYAVTSEEATAYAPFLDVNTTGFSKATAVAVLAGANDYGKSKFFFNDNEYTGFWPDYDTTPQTGFSSYDVSGALQSGENAARFQSYNATKGDNMYAMNAILVVEYSEAAPVADFTATPTSGDAPLTVQFTDASTGTISSYAWDFENDGGIDSTEQSPSYAYSAAGLYTVNLTVSNAGGSDSEVKTGYITVSESLPAVPVAAFNATPTSGDSPLEVSFTDESTGSPTSWKWSFGDGKYSRKQNPVHTYSKAGNYTVSLTVKNADGSNTTTKSDYITVSSSLPVAEFSAAPVSGSVPLEVSFIDESTGSPTSWKWDFGDGKHSGKQNPVHTYRNAGNYTVSLTVKNADGSNTTTKSDYIVVSSSLPVAAFSASPASGNAPLKVTFTDQSTGSLTYWKWSFGDGACSTARNPVHTYKKAGNYTVSLTVKSKAGSSTKTTSTIVISKNK